MWRDFHISVINVSLQTIIDFLLGEFSLIGFFFCHCFSMYYVMLLLSIVKEFEE